MNRLRPHGRRILAGRTFWLLAALALPRPSNADEAERLLGHASFPSAVRQVIDATVKAPAGKGAGPSVTADASSDDDMPAAVAGHLEKLNLKRLRLVGSDGEGSNGGGAGSAAGSALFDMHAGKLEARSEGRIAREIESKFARAIDSTPINALRPGDVETKQGRLAEIQARLAPAVESPGANPAIKPSGYHVLDVVLEMQRIDPTRDSGPDPGKFNVRVPTDSIARLQESRQRLSDLADRMPASAQPILKSLDKVVAPDFVIGIVQRKLANPASPVSGTTASDPVVPVPVRPDADVAKPAADVARPAVPGIGRPASPQVDAGLNALENLLSLDPSPASVETPDTAEPDPNARRRVDGYAGISNVVRHRLDGSVREERPAADPQRDSFVEPEIEAAVGKATRDEVGIRDIEKKAWSDRPDAAGESRLTAARERIDATLNGAMTRLQDSVNKSLADVAGKVEDGVGRAFGELEKKCKKEGDDHASKAAGYATKANAVDVPPVRYKDCFCESCGKCLWLYDCCCSSCPTPESVKANADAQAKKSALEAQAASERATADKFNQAADKVMQQKNALDATLNGIFADAAVVIPKISVGGGVEAPSDDTRAVSGDDSRTVHPHSHSLIEHVSALQRILRLSGTNLETIIATDAVNASVGNNTSAQQEIAALGGGGGTKTIDSLNNTVTVTGAVNAAIGSDSEARQVIASIGVKSGDQTVSNLTARRTVTDAVNASIGASSQADMRIASIGGSVVQGGTVTEGVIAPVNAAIGHNTESSVYVGNIDGRIDGRVKGFDIAAAAPVSAAIGGDSASSVRVGNVGDKAVIRGNLDGKVVQPAGTVSAAIGFRSTSLVDIGNLDGSVAGGATLDVATGPVVSAAIGADTTANSRIASFSPNVRVGGPLSLSANTGLVTTFAVGASTRATTDVGVIDRDVGGKANVKINVGEIMTGTVGLNTLAEAVVGSVKAPVTGDVDIKVNAGGINTFAIGLGGADAIRAQTYVGNVLSPTAGNVKIDVVTGGIVTLGFGLSLDLGFTTLNLKADGCTRIGNVGSGGC